MMQLCSPQVYVTLYSNSLPNGDNQMIFLGGGAGGCGVEISYVYFKILGVGNFNKNFLG